MHALAAELFPWHRAITGAGLRRTLGRLAEETPLEVHEVASGAPIFDFEAPDEWQIHDAYIAASDGRRVVDYAESNLHVVSHSQPYHGKLTWRELEPHLHSLPDRPDWIPYRTAFFREEWGFCLRHRDREQLAERGADQTYEVCIDAAHAPGALVYGESLLPGETDEEVLFSAHVCHPSLANDNLSAVVVAAALAQHLARWPRRKFTYRFLFAPATIGALAWLSRHADQMPHIRHGLVLAQLGDSGQFTYKRSRRRDAPIDRLVPRVLRERGAAFEIREFEPWGYDERQFCSPGFDLPMGRLTRTPDGEYPEYHTSADDLSLITPRALAESLDCCLQVVQSLESDPIYVRTDPYGEPHLAPRGLYAGYGRDAVDPQLQRAVLWLLNLADGRHGLADMVERSGLPAELLHRAAELCLQHDLVRATNGRGATSSGRTAAGHPPRATVRNF